MADQLVADLNQLVAPEKDLSPHRFLDFLDV